MAVSPVPLCVLADGKSGGKGAAGVGPVSTRQLCCLQTVRTNLI